jgi:hypothetical protein
MLAPLLISALIILVIGRKVIPGEKGISPFALKSPPEYMNVNLCGQQSSNLVIAQAHKT